MEALYSNTTGSYNAAHGYRALYSNTTGESNSAVGYQALYFNTTGVNNTAHGFRALYSNTTGANNSATGIYALYNNTTGANNTATGTNALISNTTGANNSAVGRDALYYNTIGNSNSAVGIFSSEKNTTGVGNAALGYAALYENTTGGSNTAIGREAGRFIADGTTANTVTSNSVFLGYNTKALAISQTNQIVIGDTAVGLGSNTAILGNSSITKTQLQGNVGIGTASPANKLTVSGDIGYTGVIGQGNIYGNPANNSFATMQLYNSANGFSIFNNQSYGYNFNTGGTTRVTISNAGNVGIGTASPNGKLVVQANVTAADINNIGRTQLQLRGDTDTTKQLLLGFETENNFGFIQTIDFGVSWSAYNLALQHKGGNVGIGNTNPQNKLDIVGSLGRGAPVTKTTDFTVAATENWLIMNGTATITITLPTASSWTGRELMIKNIAAYTVISASSNVKPIDTNTAATAILPAAAGSWCTLVSDGTNWVTMMN
jgi:hypothetical protein